ncbi:hypothetical protein SAMN02927923_00545 [Microvirga guangxiensis]|uniref:Uncharacterized protein n=1 Tax=Microvirga guangxiensis TaxID=549386 RepID=A0A1G5CEI1_9HYPH|nr:hypothetical protein SAMN02927923_00545 [Microvirga guangxiensis]
MRPALWLKPRMITVEQPKLNGRRSKTLELTGRNGPCLVVNGVHGRGHFQDGSLGGEIPAGASCNGLPPLHLIHGTAHLKVNYSSPMACFHKRLKSQGPPTPGLLSSGRPIEGAAMRTKSSSRLARRVPSTLCPRDGLEQPRVTLVRGDRLSPYDDLLQGKARRQMAHQRAASACPPQRAATGIEVKLPADRGH